LINALIELFRQILYAATLRCYYADAADDALSFHAMARMMLRHTYCCMCAHAARDAADAAIYAQATCRALPCDAPLFEAMRYASGRRYAAPMPATARHFSLRHAACQYGLMLRYAAAAAMMRRRERCATLRCY